MRKSDQKLSAKYKKSERFEHVISSLNEQLFHSQNDILEDSEERFPTIHILGAPRSGTTLLSQIISTYLEVAHINNLIAAFWKAPIYGVELSKKLINEKYKSDFKSDYGRTSGINEPHEFGYFWNYHLKYEDLEQKNKSHETNVDWSYLSLLIKNMTFSFGKPIIFKSFLLGFHAQKFHQQLPKSCFIYVKRNLADNVLSILKLREKLNGDQNLWGSIKPKQYNQLKVLPVYEQIVGQILCMEYEYLKQMSSIPQENKLILEYEEFCSHPNCTLDLICEKFKISKENTINQIASFNFKKTEIQAAELEKINSAKNQIMQLFPYLKEMNETI